MSGKAGSRRAEDVTEAKISLLSCTHGSLTSVESELMEWALVNHYDYYYYYYYYFIWLFRFCTLFQF